MNVFLLTRRGTLHQVVQAIDGAVTSFEADNLDDAKSEIYSELRNVPIERIKRWCSRCFRNGEKP